MAGIDFNQDENARREALEHAKVIAIIGRNADPEGSSYSVGTYLMGKGYTVYSVNPKLDEIDGQKVYADLASVPEPIDIVDVFRGAPHIPRIVEEASAVGAKTVWVQLGIVSDEARAKALELGINYIDNTCIRSEHKRLFKAAQG